MIKLFYSKDWANYELLDTGEGEKLERFGKYVFVRPHEYAVWPKTLSKKEWADADGKFFVKRNNSEFKLKDDPVFDEEGSPVKLVGDDDQVWFKNGQGAWEGIVKDNPIILSVGLQKIKNKHRVPAFGLVS